MAELLEQGGLHDGFTQLQVEGAAGQDERRVAVEALQDVTCREGAELAVIPDPGVLVRFSPVTPAGGPSSDNIVVHFTVFLLQGVAHLF